MLRVALLVLSEGGPTTGARHVFVQARWSLEPRKKMKKYSHLKMKGFRTKLLRSVSICDPNATDKK
jgi:hypothetical protein